MILPSLLCIYLIGIAILFRSVKKEGKPLSNIDIIALVAWPPIILSTILIVTLDKIRPSGKEDSIYPE